MSEPFLQTDRLLLRKLEEPDFLDFCAFAADEEMSRMMGRRILKTKEDLRTSFDWLAKKEERCYALVEKTSGRVIGELSVTAVPPELTAMDALRGKKGCSLSFSIGRAHQRRGLMSEAVRAVIDRLFFTEGMEYIQCGHFSFNQASARQRHKAELLLQPHRRLNVNGKVCVAAENVLWKEQWAADAL